MDVDPGLAAVARPGELLALPIVATLVLDEVQVTVLVNVFEELSLYVPVAVNCTIAPLATLVLVGAIAIDSSEGVDVTAVLEDGVPCEL
jgi:hypothetical protein